MRGRDDEALARTLDDEAVSVTNFEAALNNGHHFRSSPIERTKGPTGGGPPQGRRLRSPGPVADTALYQKRLARTVPDSKYNPPKRADNQIDRARVLHLPPAESPQTFGSCSRRAANSFHPRSRPEGGIAQQLTTRDETAGRGHRGIHLGRTGR